MDNYFMVMDDIVAKGVKRGRRIENDVESSESRRSFHRDVERQRRQDMASLCASLRSLLPLEYVKGRRGVSEHMEQAVKYIRDTQKKIDEMKMRRRNMSDASNTSYEVNLLRDDGMEILITAPLHHDYCFALSKVLAYLLEFGLIVTTCVSTTADHCSFHKLHVRLNEITSNIDLPELKQRLVNLIN